MKVPYHAVVNALIQLLHYSLEIEISFMIVYASFQSLQVAISVSLALVSLRLNSVSIQIYVLNVLGS